LAWSSKNPLENSLGIQTLVASFSVLHDRELAGSVYGYDPDGDAITAQLVSAPSHGILTLNADGTFGYTPDTHYIGPDSFTYTWSDGMGSSDAGTISIDVGAYAEDELCALTIETDGETRVPYCNADDEVVHGTRHDMLHIQLSRPIDQDVIVELRLGVMGGNGEPTVQESSSLFLQVGETRGKYLTIPITTDGSGHLISVCVDQETGASVDLGETCISARILAASGAGVPLRQSLHLRLYPMR
jgi:VCBS repeat-containing protein